MKKPDPTTMSDAVRSILLQIDFWMDEGANSEKGNLYSMAAADLLEGAGVTERQFKRLREQFPTDHELELARQDAMLEARGKGQP